MNRNVLVQSRTIEPAEGAERPKNLIFPYLLPTVYYLLFLTLFTFASISTGTALAQTCTPTLLGSYDTPGQAHGVYVSGSTAYVTDWDSGLQIINVSNPASPTLLGSYATGWAVDVYVSGSTAYVADQFNGLQIINVTNPASPTLLGSYDTPGQANGVYVSGSTAYVTDLLNSLQIINVSNPANPTLLGIMIRRAGHLASMSTARPPTWLMGVVVFR